MKSIKKKSLNRTSNRLKHNVYPPKHYQTNFGKKSLRVLGPKIWNTLPENIKGADSLRVFKSMIKKVETIIDFQ